MKQLQTENCPFIRFNTALDAYGSIQRLDEELP